MTPAGHPDHRRLGGARRRIRPPMRGARRGARSGRPPPRPARGAEGASLAATSMSSPPTSPRPARRASLIAELEAEGLAVDTLINNAGFGLAGKFAGLPRRPAERDDRPQRAHPDRALPPRPPRDARARASGAILNVASTAAFQPGPNMAVYYRDQGLCPLLHRGAAPRAEGQRDQGLRALPRPDRDRVRRGRRLEEPGAGADQGPAPRRSSAPASRASTPTRRSSFPACPTRSPPRSAASSRARRCGGSSAAIKVDGGT